MERDPSERRGGDGIRPDREPAPDEPPGRQPVALRGDPGSAHRGAPDPLDSGQPATRPSSDIEPPATPDGTFVKVRREEHPLPGACEVTVYFQDYHRSSSKFGRFGKIVGMDHEAGEYLVMLDNFECVSAPMRRVEWRKVAT